MRATALSLDAAASGRKNRTQINDMFDGHVSGRRIEGTLDRLVSKGRITRNPHLPHLPQSAGPKR